MTSHGYRPGSIVAASVLMGIFGGLTVLGSGCIGTLTFMPDLIKLPGPLAEERLFELDPRIVKELPSYPIVEGASYVVSTILGIAIMVAGIGVFMMNERARIMGVWLAIAELILELGHAAYNAAIVLPIQNRLDAEEMPMNADLAAMSWIGLGVGVAITLAIWLTVLALLNSANARAACTGELNSNHGPRDWDDQDDDFDEDDDDRSYPRRSTPPDTSIQ